MRAAAHAREVVPPAVADTFEKLSARLMQSPMLRRDAVLEYGRTGIDFLIACGAIRCRRRYRNGIRGSVPGELELTGCLPRVPVGWSVRERGRGLVEGRRKACKVTYAEIRAENTTLRRRILDLERELSELRGS